MRSPSFARLAGRPSPDQAGSKKARGPAGRGLTWTASRRPVQSEIRTGPAGLLRRLHFCCCFASFVLPPCFLLVLLSFVATQQGTRADQNGTANEPLAFKAIQAAILKVTEIRNRKYEATNYFLIAFKADNSGTEQGAQSFRMIAEDTRTWSIVYPPSFHR